MFDALSEKLQETLADVRAHGTLTEDDINKAMREIRLALLEADVNFKVVKQFTATVKERCLGAEVVGQLNPGQQVVKIVHEELAALMGGASAGITFSPRPPTVILMAGLQGSGKTTACAKLARYLMRRTARRSRSRPATSTARPRSSSSSRSARRSAPTSTSRAPTGPGRDRPVGARPGEDGGQGRPDRRHAGRLHVDAALMDELVAIRKAIKPHDILLVVDAMTGQDAVNVAEQFAEAVEFDGVVMTKLDGDARGGAALSVKAVTGKPILFASVGEKLDQFERFHPERMAQRILGMGDVMSLIEKAERQFEEDEARELERKLRRNEFTLEDFLKQLKTAAQDGAAAVDPRDDARASGHQLSEMKVDERELDRVEAIILSMTPEERRRPELIKGSRRLRIAKGSGTSVQPVNQLVKQFDQMRKLMRQIRRGKMPDLGALMRQAR